MIAAALAGQDITAHDGGNDPATPLTAEELRELLDKTRQVYAMLMELREFRDKLPAAVENMPAPLRMMLGSFLG